MIPGENDVPPVRDGVAPFQASPVTGPNVPAAPAAPAEINQQLPRPKFPQVGRIPETLFVVDFVPRTLARTPSHAFYGERVSGGVNIYSGLLVVFIADITGSSGSSPPGFTSAVQQIYTPAGMASGAPVFVAGGTGDVVCLCAEILAATIVVTDVGVRVATPNIIEAQTGGTLAIEIGTITATGFTQNLRSDFFYTSLVAT